jgi:hypothetical protein
MLQYGGAEKVIEDRAEVLQEAYATHPERFVRGCPQRQVVPTEVWINPPTEIKHTDKKRLPETHCPWKPDASLTHPRLGYPSSSCVPAELDSVSPSEVESSASARTLQPSLNTRAMPEKIPGVWGLAPGEAKMAPTTEKALH